LGLFLEKCGQDHHESPEAPFGGTEAVDEMRPLDNFIRNKPLAQANALGTIVNTNGPSANLCHPCPALKLFKASASGILESWIATLHHHDLGALNISRYGNARPTSCRRIVRARNVLKATKCGLGEKTIAWTFRPVSTILSVSRKGGLPYFQW